MANSTCNKQIRPKVVSSRPKIKTTGIGGKNWQDFFIRHDAGQISPELIFIRNNGVFIAPNFNLAKTAQLRCYNDVISRVLGTAALNPLQESDIVTLLNWDAEKFRKKLSI